MKVLFTNAQDGMTLIEVMIAITLMATIAAFSSSSLNLALKSWEKSTVRVDKQTELQHAEAFLRRQIGQTKDFTVVSNQGSRKPFTGKKKSLKFVSRLRIGSPGAGLYLTEFTIKGNMSNSVLLLTYNLWQKNSWEINNASKTASDINTVKLLQDIKKADFSYFGKDIHNQYRWMDNWHDLNHLPNLVKLSINMTNTDPVLNIVFPIHVSAN